MNSLNTVEEAQKLLDEIQEEIRKYDLIFLNEPRKDGTTKNADTLAKLAITSKIQREIINNLTAEDYVGGPEDDHKSWRTIAVFGTDYNGFWLYIKFSVGFDGTAVICISFHEAEYPMKFKFK